MGDPQRNIRVLFLGEGEVQLGGQNSNYQEEPGGRGLRVGSGMEDAECLQREAVAGSQKIRSASFFFQVGEIYACLQAERGEGASGEGVIEDSGERR